MTRVSGEWLSNAATQSLCGLFDGAGYRALFVGGCVRNALLDVAVSDVDISTDALPEQVLALAEGAGLHAIPTGIDHGTVTVVAGGIAHEITTFRKDVETDGRRAVVAFSKRIEDDALRRDFTMNALYADARGDVLDPLGSGLTDLASRQFRFIENAADRIQEDYLRILRFFRFHAWYGDPDAGIDPDGLAACAQYSAGIETLSKERVGSEMKKLCAAPNPSASVASMAASGVLAQVLAGADARALPILVDQEEAQGVAPEALRRLVVLAPALADQMVDLMRLSREETRRAAVLAEGVGSGVGALELGYRLGGAVAIDILLLRAALMEHAVQAADTALARQGAAAQFPLKAKDLMPKFSGKALGEQIKKLEARWLASGCVLTREALLG